jgi:hypothetical protein
MIAMRPAQTRPGRLLWLDVALALLAALAYLLIAIKVLGVGDLQPAEDGGTIVYVAAACYLGGGLLILTCRRGLWLAGAGINVLVMLVFFLAYQDRPAVLLSPGGLVTKAAQVLLEVGLLALIITDWRRARRSTA